MPGWGGSKVVNMSLFLFIKLTKQTELFTKPSDYGYSYMGRVKGLILFRESSRKKFVKN